VKLDGHPVWGRILRARHCSTANCFSFLLLFCSFISSLHTASCDCCCCCCSDCCRVVVIIVVVGRSSCCIVVECSRICMGRDPIRDSVAIPVAVVVSRERHVVVVSRLVGAGASE
jgi:hypothetical protein